MIEEAIKTAKRSSASKYYQTGAVIVNRDGKVLSRGWSHIPELKRFRLYSLHAELHALARARFARISVDGAACYVATVSRKSGDLTDAKPCLSCAVALHAAGIDICYFTVRSRLPGACNTLLIDLLLEPLKQYADPNGNS